MLPTTATKTKNFFLCLLFLIPIVSVQSQINDPHGDSAEQKHPGQVLKRYHEVLRHNDPMMYLAFPIIKPVLERTVPLQDGEGKSGYWTEGHFGNRFVIYQGKYYSHPFFHRLIYL